MEVDKYYSSEMKKKLDQEEDGNNMERDGTVLIPFIKIPLRFSIDKQMRMGLKRKNRTFGKKWILMSSLTMMQKRTTFVLSSMLLYLSTTIACVIFFIVYPFSLFLPCQKELNAQGKETKKVLDRFERGGGEMGDGVGDVSGMDRMDSFSYSFSIRKRARSLSLMKRSCHSD